MLLHKALLASSLFWVTAAAPSNVPASQPTCPNGEPTCTTTQSAQPVCSLWYDGEFTYSGNLKLKKGDPVGEPDVVIPWHNHDRWAWTAWHRYSYFFEEAEKDDHVFAPGYTYPLECHKRLGNFQVTDPTIKTVALADASSNDIHYAQNQSVPLMANRAVTRGEVVYTTCRHPDLSSKMILENLPEYEPGYFRNECSCIDVIKPAPSTIPNAGMGAFSKYAVAKGGFVAFAAAMHMKRTELHNKTSNEHELLLNYAYGHPQTQLLFVPAGPGVNYINHASEGYEPNVKLVWSLDDDDSIENHFTDKPSHIMFSRSERPSFYFRYEALRKITPGEELLMDYGKDWDNAWMNYVKGCGGVDKVAACKGEKAFRHEISVPDNFFPLQWLANEVAEVPKFTWDLPDLEPGEVAQIQVHETGAHPMAFGHRVGLPEGFHEKIRDYADRTGITDIMKNYITGGHPLELGGTEHHRINGGAWWVKRFDSEWESNMHYITPDDDRSNTDFLSALGEAGFDQVLQALGEHFGLDGLICYYASFIAVNHCSGSYPHVDAEETNGKGFNMLFPVVQANESTPELMLGEDGFGPLVIPYRYEPKHGILLGDDGVHHTSPSDYRRTGEMRMVISVYMADINEDNRWKVFWDSDSDPPFPPVRTRMRYLMKNAGRDWKKGADNKLPVRDESFS